MTTTLVVDQLSVRYGARVAVDGVSFATAPGVVLGLIGPNGAGKTSVLNACTGSVRPSRGSVLLHGSDVTGLSPASRARRGLGRTFQRPALFESLSVFDNVMLGWEAGQATRNPLRHLWASHCAGAEGDKRAVTALRQCGVQRIAARPLADLTTGERRLVELARVIAGGFSVLLLDEPSSGLGQSDKERFTGVLCELAQRRNLSVVIVEHDMNIVASVCHQVVVLDAGHILHTGPPEELRKNETVRRAYLGESGP